MTAETTFGGLSQEAWDQLAGPHFYSTSKWLRYCTAETGTPGSAVVSRVGHEPAWAVPVRELGGLPEWSRYRWNDHLSQFGLPTLAPTGTLVGAPEGFRTSFLSAGARPAAALAALVAQLRQQLHSTEGRPNGRACVAMYTTSDDVRALRAAGVDTQPVLLDADAWLAIPSGGWPAWLDSLASSNRKLVRKEHRAFHEAGYRIVHMPLAECWDQLGVAAAATLLKYGHHTTPETELISLRRAVEHLGDTARVAVCYLRDERPVGFLIYYQWGDTIFNRWLGLDYERLAGAREYFQLCYYTHLERAQEHGARWLHVGLNPQPASMRGGELRPVWLVDLTQDSALHTGADQVHRHNVRMYEELAGDPRTAGALVADAWKPFL